MERKEALENLRNLIREFPAGTGSVTELDEVVVVLLPLLHQVLPAFVLAGVRTLDGREAELRDDTEAEYWFSAADPELTTAMSLWLLRDLCERLKRAGQVEVEVGPRGQAQVIPLNALLALLKKGG